MTSIKLTKDLHARLVSESVAPATKWPLENWNFHPPGEPGQSKAQVQIFYDKGAWHLWTGNITREETRRLGMILVRKRNGSKR